MGALFTFANILRWWVIRTLAGHWNVEVMASTRVGVVTSGPYRWVRHPNYVAVVAELFALPMIHTAWITALVGTAAYLEILRRRVSRGWRFDGRPGLSREHGSEAAISVPRLF